MEEFRLKCLKDPIMQALYRNEIKWSDVPDDDPPLELDDWKEDKARQEMDQLIAELERLPPLQSGRLPDSLSVPSSPIAPSVSLHSWRKHSAPNTPRKKMAELRLDTESVAPPCTPIHRPLPPLQLPPPLRLKRFAPKILDSIREVDSAPSTPPNERYSPVPHGSHGYPMPRAPSPIQGAWKHRAHVKEVISAAPILNQSVAAAAATVRWTVCLQKNKKEVDRSLPPIESIRGAATRQYGKVTHLLLSRRGDVAFLRFANEADAARAVQKGLTLRHYHYTVEYSRTEMNV